LQEPSFSHRIVVRSNCPTEDLLYGPSEKPAVRRWGKQQATKEEADGPAVSGKRWRAKG